VHVVRIPVELVLWQLYQQKAIPVDMTFEGSNFDIIAGLTAPLAATYCFRNDTVNKKLLLVWNFIALGLLLNIIIIAVKAAPSPFQSIAFDQPNKAVLYFPFVWLPTFVVPVVLFAHLLVIKRLLAKR
jgi:hypothetical protein